MPTVQRLLDDIDARLPNTFTATQKTGWMNDCQNEIWRYMASTEIYEFDTIAGQALYNMASDMDIDMIKQVLVSNSTTIDGSETYSPYDYKGMDDELSDNAYYDALGQIGIYPKPSSDTGSGYKVKVYYEPSPVQLSTNTLTTVPSINTEYHDVLKFRVMKIIAGSGNNQDMTIKNENEFQEGKIMKRIMMNYNKRKYKKPKETYDYREGWDK